MSDPSRDLDVVGLLGPLRRYALSLTRDPQDAEDLVHDALVRAIERQDRFRKGGNLRSWLMSILHNRFIDEARRKRADRARDAAIDLHAEAAVSGGQDEATRLADVRRSFMMLPDEQRAALHLVTVEGLSYNEAADALGIPVGTLVSRLSRARARLREIEDGPIDAQVVPFRARGVHDAS
ncbi:sigma-70 family RNA polymerase sigma factor [Aureimonas mangrovi]|uniref:sigma-70 family RNA polymerase sigma factor n=1 Tax=Aureimonas mangrovi TaxID=2758041 RepID=UPI00163D9877|nr:sigma-70 family RNA polymerase sigma factor [Aureimonas mangrovi]